jgi:hypothetical protein
MALGIDAHKDVANAAGVVLTVREKRCTPMHLKGAVLSPVGGGANEGDSHD